MGGGRLVSDREEVLRGMLGRSSAAGARVVWERAGAMLLALDWGSEEVVAVTDAGSGGTGGMSSDDPCWLAK